MKNKNVKCKMKKGNKENKKRTLTLGTPNFYHTSMVTPDAKPITQNPNPRTKTQNLKPL